MSSAQVNIPASTGKTANTIALRNGNGSILATGIISDSVSAGSASLESLNVDEINVAINATGITAGMVENLGSAAMLNSGAAPGNVPVIGVDGKLASSLLPVHVASWNGSTGAVTATTSNLPEGANLYHTAARVEAIAPNVTIGTANGLSISAGQVLSLGVATTSSAGAMSGTDKTTLEALAAESRIVARSNPVAITGNGTAQTIFSITIPGGSVEPNDVLVVELGFRRTAGSAAATLAQTVAGAVDSTGLGNGPCEQAQMLIAVTGASGTATIESNVQTILGAGRSMAVATNVNLANNWTISATINPASGINYTTSPVKVRRFR
jgi:hypothetical protein